MALPFLNGNSKKRDQVVGIDLGGRMTKAVLLQRKPEGLALLRYAVMDAPIQKSFAAETLADQLKSLIEALDTKTKTVSISIGVGDSIVRHAELPQMPVPDMRQILKINSKNYLQQDLPNHVFDCYIMPPRPGAKPEDKAKLLSGPQKYRVLVAGTKKQFLDDVQTAVKSAGLVADQICPGLIGPVNAFELAMPEAFHKGTVALVDTGFKHTTITILHEGELALSRVVALGGDRFTAGLVESMGITYGEAEGIKVGMPTEVQSTLESLLTPLGRELRASIDFFEHQHEQHVSQVYISGGSSRSEFIVKLIETELMIPCRTWNPLGPIQLALSPQQTAEIEQVAAQLTVALGAAAGSLSV